jgi:hypothetical protein
VFDGNKAQLFKDSFRKDRVKDQETEKNGQGPTRGCGWVDR